jgi:hypothetical protein
MHAGASASDSGSTFAELHGRSSSIPVVAALQQKLQLTGTLEDDGASHDLFGCAVAVNGDTALVGARDDSVGSVLSQGSVHVYVRAGTTWTLEAKLVADDGAKDRRIRHVGVAERR